MDTKFFLLCLIISRAFGGKLSCDFCMEIIKQVDDLIAANSSITELEEVATILCEYDKAGGECEGPHDSWQCQQVCELAIQTYEPMVDYLLIRYMDPRLICYNVENNTFGCEKPQTPDPTPVPNIIYDNDTRTNFNNSNQFGYILHIPDLHWDQQYTANSVANCGEPVCCRSYDNDHNYSEPLLYGGMYGIAAENIVCDTPKSVIVSMIDYIANDIILNNSDGININNLDFIVFVGDAQAHDVYNQSKVQHLNLMQDWINLLKDGLDRFNIPIFMDLGNHEGLPVDNFGGPDVDDWFNGPFGGWISQWIDTSYSVKYDAVKPSEILSYSGYYTSLIRRGFRLIAINSGYMATGNYYLKFTQYDDPYIDMGGQFKWLKETLYRSKFVLNETVIIIQHHPVSTSVEQLQKAYYGLYEEYGDIIMTILAGHTHTDHFHTLGNDNFTDTEKNKPFATWFSPGAVGQYQGRNPGFRVYKYDRKSFEMVNYYQYRMDTNRSNVEMKAHWFKAYDALSEYDLKDISPESMSDLGYRLATNDTLWDLFTYNFYNGIVQSLEKDRNATVCGLLTATSAQQTSCRNNAFQSDLTTQQFADLYY